MEKVVCDRQDCQQSAVKYCFNCKAMLCKLHRIADVKAQLTSQLPEHFHIEAFRYSSDPSQFVRLYCDIHPCELLTHRCVNCMQFACQQCILSWCPKAAGRYHDYDKIADFAGRFKEKINELKEKLQLKNELFLQELKDSSRKLEETRMDLNQMLQKVDETVESKVATLRKEGERLKNEIVIEMTEATGEIEMQIKYVEEKEAACKTLLDSIHELLTTAADYTVVLNYRKIYEEVNDLLKSRIKDFEPTPVKLIQGTQSKMSLDLALTGTVVRTAFHNSDYLLPREEVKAEIKCVGHHTADEQVYKRLIFLSPGTIITSGWDSSSHSWFTEIVEAGKARERKYYDCLVDQLLLHGSEILILTSSRVHRNSYTHWGMYKIHPLNSETTLCEFTGYPFAYIKLMTVTSNNQLIYLHIESNTLQFVSLVSSDKTRIKLRIGFIVYGIFLASDGHLILSCYYSDKQAIVKYNLQTMEIVWSCDLLAYSISEKFHVAEYLDILYIISQKKPTKVMRLCLSDGGLKDEIPCDGLPSIIEDISIRGNILAVAGGNEGISYFRITDVM